MRDIWIKNMYIHKIAAGNVAEVPRKPHTIGFPAKL